MGKGRDLGVLSAARKLTTIREIIEKYNPTFYDSIMLLPMKEALTSICIEYGVRSTIRPQNLNDFARSILEKVMLKHGKEMQGKI